MRQTPLEYDPIRQFPLAGSVQNVVSARPSAGFGHVHATVLLLCVLLASEAQEVRSMGLLRHELASSQGASAASTAHSIPGAGAASAVLPEQSESSEHSLPSSAFGSSAPQQLDSVERSVLYAMQHAQSSSSPFAIRGPGQAQHEECSGPSCSHGHSSTPSSSQWQAAGNGELLNGTSQAQHDGHHHQPLKSQRHQQQHSQQQHQHHLQSDHHQHKHRQQHLHQHVLQPHLSLPSLQQHRSPLPPLQRHRRTLSQQVDSQPSKQHRHRRTLSLHEELQLQHGKQLALALEQQGSPLPQWEKVLWKQQPFPDTYTDATFLKELVVNADVPKRSYWRVVLGSAAVTQQISTVIAAVVVPVHLRQHNFTAQSVLAVCAVLLVIGGYSICCFIGGHILGGSLRRGIRQVLLLTGGVYLLSPLLHSLTRTISEDSIIAMTVGLLILHLYLHDYNFVNSVTDKLTGTVSLGAAVLASVLIASGMPSEYDVFVHILFCLELYLLSPFMRRYIRQASLMAHIALTMGMVGTAMGLLLPLSPNLTTVFLVVVVFISFLCPRWLVRIHKFKAKINGPWDEAVPQIANVLTQQPGWEAGTPAALAPHAKLA